MTKQFRDVGLSSEVEVTEDMIDAGYAILQRSGVVDDLLEADKELVFEIFRAMIQQSDDIRCR